jgi:hypothetical protein
MFITLAKKMFQEFSTYFISSRLYVAKSFRKSTSFDNFMFHANTIIRLLLYSVVTSTLALVIANMIATLNPLM